MVLDASAILAMLFDEPGGDFVASRLANSLVSAVNAVEVETKLMDHGIDAGKSTVIWTTGPIGIQPLEYSVAHQAAILHHRYRTQKVSLADAVCLATAMYFSLPVLTADSLWSDLGDLDVEVELIR